MTLPNWLGALKMSVSWHGVFNILFGCDGDDFKKTRKLLVNLAKFISQPHAHVADNLLVAVSASVEFTGNIFANNLA